MQIEFVSVQSLPRISRWFSSAKNVKMQWNQSAGTREWAAKCSLRNKTQPVGSCWCQAALQHGSNPLLKCPLQDSTGGCTTPCPSLPLCPLVPSGRLCHLPQMASTQLRMREVICSWMDEMKRETQNFNLLCHFFLCEHVAHPFPFVSSGFLHEHLITVKALSQETRKCALRGSWKQHVHIGFHCHCSICIVQDINLIIDASPQLGKKTPLSKLN